MSSAAEVRVHRLGWMALSAIVALGSCAGASRPPATLVAEDVSPTAVSPSAEGPGGSSEAQGAVEEAAPVAVSATPTAAPVPVSPAGWWWDEDVGCQGRADRFEWQRYALAAGFPAGVVAGEMVNVVARESRGDLCAVNDISGATCWVQQHPGGPEYLEPSTCMAAGYAKWVDGGESFWRHWYRWW